MNVRVGSIPLINYFGGSNAEDRIARGLLDAIKIHATRHADSLIASASSEGDFINGIGQEQKCR